MEETSLTGQKEIDGPIKDDQKNPSKFTMTNSRDHVAEGSGKENLGWWSDQLIEGNEKTSRTEIVHEWYERSLTVCPLPIIYLLIQFCRVKVFHCYF